MFVKSVSFLPAGIKSVNPMQKYPHITELFACTQKILLLCFYSQQILKFLQEHVQHQNYRNKQFHFCYKIKQSNMCLHPHIHQGLLCMPHLLLFYGNYFLKKHL